MLALFRIASFLATFYGLYFSHHYTTLQITVLHEIDFLWTAFPISLSMSKITHTYNTRLWVAGPYSKLTMLTASTMPQAGFQPPIASRPLC